MRLKNKKTGEIVAFGEGIINLQEIGCENVADMLEQGWEDYEEPESKIIHLRHNEFVQGRHIVEIDYTDYREAERAVKKLEAWKRLKDKGFRFILDGETEMPMFVYSGANGEKCITSAEESKQCRNDIKLLFGGEE